MKWFVAGSLACLMALAWTAVSQAAILTNGQLSVNISNTDGSINSALFHNNEYWNAGTQTSNFGFQLGITTASNANFRINKNDNLGSSNLGSATVTTSGNLSTPAGQVKVTGTYAPTSFASIGYTRTYQILAGLNVLRTTLTLINNSTSTDPRTITAFDTFDPDQGVTANHTTPGSGTSFSNNDVLASAVPGLNVVRATSGRSVVMGGKNGVVGTANTTTSSGYFGIDTGARLLNFFTSPVDRNNGSFDEDISIAFRTTLAQGGTVTWHFDQAFGDNAAQALAQFNQANATAAVPEPATMLMWGMGALALGMGARRRKIA